MPHTTPTFDYARAAAQDETRQFFRQAAIPHEVVAELFQAAIPEDTLTIRHKEYAGYGHPRIEDLILLGLAAAEVEAPPTPELQEVWARVRAEVVDPPEPWIPHHLREPL